MKVFLSGAVEGVGDLANGWRTEARLSLEDAGFEVITPLINAEQQVFRTPNEIVRRNFHLQKQCDLLLVEYLIPNRCYVGTDAELMKALEWNQPAIVFAHEMYINRIYLQYLSTVIVESLGEALKYIVDFYNPKY